MYVWELKETSCFDGSSECTLFKDDDEALDKIKKIIQEYVYHDIAECEDRASDLQDVGGEVLERTLDWIDSLAGKLNELENYKSLEQFKKFRLFSCDLYLIKVEVK